jgi:hypothetical protein
VSGHSKAHVVEVEPSGARWIKSSASTGNNTNCVEIAVVGETVLVRNSRHRSGMLIFPAPSWQAFLPR